MLKINNVYNMDCMEGIKLLDDKSIDLVIIDPPYKLNLSKLKHPSSFNSYANELLDLKDGFEIDPGRKVLFFNSPTIFTIIFS